MSSYKKDEESGVGSFFQDKTVRSRFPCSLLPPRDTSRSAG